MSAYALLDHRVASRGNLGRASPPAARPDRAAQRRTQVGGGAVQCRPKASLKAEVSPPHAQPWSHRRGSNPRWRGTRSLQTF